MNSLQVYIDKAGQVSISSFSPLCPTIMMITILQTITVELACERCKNNNFKLNNLRSKQLYICSIIGIATAKIKFRCIEHRPSM